MIRSVLTQGCLLRSVQPAITPRGWLPHLLRPPVRRLLPPTLLLQLLRQHLSRAEAPLGNPPARHTSIANADATIFSACCWVTVSHARPHDPSNPMASPAPPPSASVAAEAASAVAPSPSAAVSASAINKCSQCSWQLSAGDDGLCIECQQWHVCNDVSGVPGRSLVARRDLAAGVCILTESNSMWQCTIDPSVADLRRLDRAVIGSNI